jgi:ATP-binding cassette subfamily B protein
MIFRKFPHYTQIEHTDCGATCLKIILKYYGKECNLKYLRELTQVTRSGVTLEDIYHASIKLNFEANPLKATLEGLKMNVFLPCVLHWEQDHFVVLYKIKKSNFYISDPSFGKLKLKEEEFNKLWSNLNNEGGIALELKPNINFKEIKLPHEITDYSKILTFIKSLLTNQKNKIYILFIMIGLSTSISYIFPQTIQNLFDNGYASKDIKVIISIFGFQLLLFFGQAIFYLVQSFIGVHFSTQVSIKNLNNLLEKVVKLPIHFFENRLFSDILQKIEEQSKIEHLITKQLISTIFSLFLFIALAIRLFFYNFYLAFGFIFLTIFSLFWMYIFYNKRKAIDYYLFKLLSENKNHLIEMITGMVTVKITNSQILQLQKWKILQNKLYLLKVRSLILDNYQNYTMTFLKQLLILFITFLCSYWVIVDKLTFGEMLSIGYIIGLMSQPLDSIILFIRSFQDSKLVFDRTQDIYNSDDENTNRINTIKNNVIFDDINIINLSFKYYGGNQPYVLQNINLTIPHGKTTAIVGESGSGKTTLLKILLNFYPIPNGNLMIGNTNLLNINSDLWRKHCGVVMQDGYIFSGTIAENISMQGNDLNINKLTEVTKAACIYDFIINLPLGFKTKIGSAGSDLSGGQKQRILIARAIYNNPNFLFFDEATSSLDAKNERNIMQNLEQIFKGKTVITIAHRLSTVKNADQIVVLEKGKIIELGTHVELVKMKGKYFNLVKNQLELGN